MIIDLHIHTKYSRDASIKPSELIKVAKARGLDGIAVTNHDTTRGWAHFSVVDDFTVIQGIERTTDHGSIIGLFLNEGIDAYGFWEAVDQIRSQDGIVVLPHPCDTFRRDTPRIRALDKGLLKAKIDWRRSWENTGSGAVTPITSARWEEQELGSPATLRRRSIVN